VHNEFIDKVKKNEKLKEAYKQFATLQQNTSISPKKESKEDADNRSQGSVVDSEDLEGSSSSPRFQQQTGPVLSAAEQQQLNEDNLRKERERERQRE